VGLRRIEESYHNIKTGRGFCDLLCKGAVEKGPEKSWPNGGDIAGATGKEWDGARGEGYIISDAINRVSTAAITHAKSQTTPGGVTGNNNPMLHDNLSKSSGGLKAGQHLNQGKSFQISHGKPYFMTISSAMRNHLMRFRIISLITPVNGNRTDLIPQNPEINKDQQPLKKLLTGLQTIAKISIVFG